MLSLGSLIALARGAYQAVSLISLFYSQYNSYGWHDDLTKAVNKLKRDVSDICALRLRACYPDPDDRHAFLQLECAERNG